MKEDTIYNKMIAGEADAKSYYDNGGNMTGGVYMND
jgi:hypothetical protein